MRYDAVLILTEGIKTKKEWISQREQYLEKLKAEVTKVENELQTECAKLKDSEMILNELLYL